MRTSAIATETRPVIWSDPERLSGEVCFTGTRVPVRILFEYLMAGEPLSEFLAGFPSVSEEQAKAVLQEAFQRLLQLPCDESIG